jgi:hypothetical protein
LTRDPFLRLGLVACCSLYVLGLVLVGVYVAVWAAAAVVAVGVLLAVALTVEAAPVESEQKINGDANPDRPKGFIRMGPGGDR